eukprot:TRINITY_DN3809_c0_g1_i5.p1 TRINITY_DN3809_c0_g1~~TRINITY_DN3809_c0_g1_i5.p1  ORF type:complete len:289 (-),score=35.15 TRINITY_DN3809_c0_g1_i5:123-989(-)
MIVHRSKKSRVKHKASYPAYEHRVSFYKIPPTENVTIEEFEGWAIDRLQVLREIDNAKMKGLKPDEINERLNKVVAKYLPLREGNEQDIRKDVVSHFVLRMAYCNPADRKWFITQERSLLDHRLTDVSITDFLEENDLDYPTLSKEEYDSVQDDLKAVAETALVFDRSGVVNKIVPLLAKLGPHSFHKMPFEEAAELVAQRRVLVRGGQAYIYHEQLVSIIIGRFQGHLAEALLHTYKALPQSRERFQRLTHFLDTVSKQYLGVDYSQSRTTSITGNVTPVPMVSPMQ